MKKTFILFLLTALIAANSQQIGINAVNTMGFGIGNEWAGLNKDVKIERMYFEDRLDIDIFRGGFFAAFSFEAADPGPRNESLKEFTRFGAGYSEGRIIVSAGDFYGYFGRGLVLGLKESRADFFDSRIRGGSFQYSGDHFGVKALGGKSYFKYVDDLNPADQKIESFDNVVLGTEVTLPLSSYFDMDEYHISAGASYLFIESDKNTPEDQYLYSDMFIKETGIIGTTFEFEAYGFELFSEYAVKTTKRDPVQTGWAHYMSLNYTTRGFSIGLEFKDYYKYGANPNSISSSFTPYQSAPEVIIEHSSNLLNTNQRIINPNDEIGYKLSTVYMLNQRTELKGYAAFASFHDGGSFLPSFSEDFLPYTDYWLGMNYTQDKYGIVLGGGYFFDSPLSQKYNKDVVPGSSSNPVIFSDTRNTYLAGFFFKPGRDYKISVSGEFQTVSNEFNNENYEDIYASFEFAYLPVGYFNISFINTTQKVTGDSPTTWPGFEAGFDITDKHKLNLFYGRERAGIKCAGGTCRQVPEFDGFKVSLVSYF